MLKTVRISDWEWKGESITITIVDKEQQFIIVWSVYSWCHTRWVVWKQHPTLEYGGLLLRHFSGKGVLILQTTWWHHQMETFSPLLAICVGNSPFPGEFPKQRPVTRSFDVFFDLRLNKLLSKQSWGWWLETLSCPLWRHCNELSTTVCIWIKGTDTQNIPQNISKHIHPKIPTLAVITVPVRYS